MEVVYIKPEKVQGYFKYFTEKVVHKIQAQAHVGMVHATQQSACQARVGMELAARNLCKSLIIKHLRGAPPTPTQVVDYQAFTQGAG